ncbi:MAG: DEAD/DEAH box helicase family protein [Nitrosopumilaceae archaeon]|nr:DEAD/DEAH box helicase family protein [Nitrosopumilaceae archaeon]
MSALDATAKTEAAKTAKNLCMTKFKEWWTLEEMIDAISELSMGSDILLQIQSSGAVQVNQDSMADVLYDVVGPRFLRSIGDDKDARRTFLTIIIASGVTKGFFTEDAIMEAAAEFQPDIKYMNDVISMRPTQKWCLRLAEIFDLPASVAEKERAGEPPSIETVEPHVPLNPLYDYQYSTGRFVRSLLEGTQTEGGREVKRKMIAVPTGSGKTRMITETLVEWLNDGKPSRNPQQRDSRFILWIAQSHELCEQARSTFKDVFKSTGKEGTVMRLYKFWGKENALPSLDIEDLLDEKGVIVASIQSLYSIGHTKPQELINLGNYVSCIVVDEAHHSVAPSYSFVLRRMGFNWDNRKKEISEKGIILLGLTATPFRGSGDVETRRLHRWYNGVYFPSISYMDKAEDSRPHALIDCPAAAYAGTVVRMLGEKSYDLDGFIIDHRWIIRGGNGEWAYPSTKNAAHVFDEPGEYRIELLVTDNDGNTGESGAVIQIEPPHREEIKHEEMQKVLYGRLIQRRILCEVYHKVIVSKSAINLTMKDVSDIETYGEFQSKTLNQIGASFERNALILRGIKRMSETGRRKILFFGCSVEHSRKIAISLKAMYGMRTGYVDSAMDMDSRIAAIQDFRRGGTEVLCNFGVLTTGFDAPGVDCVFVGRPVRSALLYTQMIGRGMRGTKNGGTEDMIIVDIDDNFQINETRYQPISDEMGWKVYREYWKVWHEPEVEEAEEEAEEADVSHTCTACGRAAHGATQIKEFFGFECPDDILIEYCQDGGQALPQECQGCRQ